MTDTIRLIVKRTKLATDTDQSLIIELPRINGSLDSVEQVALEGYSITGSVGAVPADVMVQLTGAGTDMTTYVSHTLSNNTRIRLQEGFLPIFPPGGAATFERTNLVFDYKPGRRSNMDLSGRIVLTRFDPVSQMYVLWTDWTNATFLLTIKGHIGERTRTVLVRA